MEHLLDEEDLVSLQDSIPDVPWLGFDHDTVQEYGVVHFEQYPILRGWSREELEYVREGNVLPGNVTSTLALLQSWLFFGFLESACQEHFSSADFVVLEKKVLKTGFLRKYFRDKAAELRITEQTKALSFLNTLKKSQEAASRWVVTLNLAYSEKTNNLTAKSLAPITRAAALLGEMLYHFEEISATYCETWLLHESPPWDYSPLNESKLLERLQSRGWCRSTYNFLIRYGISVIEFASLTVSTDLRVGNHEDCSQTECHAHNVKTDSYQTLHLTTGCHCEFVRAPFEDVQNLLRRGHVFAIDSDALLGLSHSDPAVVQIEDNMSFVAFSHIWSDGMGSNTEAGLPKCQVGRLRDLAEETKPANGVRQLPLIWVDSLCIPLEEEARRSAISAMATIFKKASRTVVLDAGLLRYDPFKRSLQELAVKILASTWMRRLWTLQEGALAAELFFILDTGSVAVSANWVVAQAEEFSHCLITMALARALTRMTNGSTNKPRTLGALLPLVGFRSCSKPEDETLALAPVLGLDVSPLLAETGEERMARFWNLVEHVPLGLIFLDGPKLQKPGLRWALKSISTRGTADTVYGSADAVVTKDGLLAEYLVLRLDKHTEVDCDSVYHISFRAEHDPTPMSSQVGGDRHDQTSLNTKEKFDMAIKTISKVPSIPCAAIALVDRFLPESYAVLLMKTPQGGRYFIHETYQYAGLAFMMEVNGLDAVVNKICGTAKMRRICIS